MPSIARKNGKVQSMRVRLRGVSIFLRKPELRSSAMELNQSKTVSQSGTIQAFVKDISV